MRVSAIVGGITTGLIIWFSYASTSFRILAAWNDEETFEATNWAVLAAILLFCGAANVWLHPRWASGLFGLAALASVAMTQGIQDGWVFLGVSVVLAIHAWKAQSELDDEIYWKSEIQSYIRSHQQQRVTEQSADLSFYQKLKTANSATTSGAVSAPSEWTRQ